MGECQGPREGVTPNQPGGHTGTRPTRDREWADGLLRWTWTGAGVELAVVSDSKGVFRADFR